MRHAAVLFSRDRLSVDYVQVMTNGGYAAVGEFLGRGTVGYHECHVADASQFADGDDVCYRRPLQ